MKRSRFTAAALLLYCASFFAQAPAVEWFRGQGTSGEEHVHEGMQTADGGYIAIGHGVEKEDDDDMLIIKTSINGISRWQRKFGTATKRGAGYCIAEFNDGFIAGGAIYDDAVQRTQRFLVRLDLSGTVIWEKFYSSEGVGGIRGIDINDDGSIVVTGYKNAPDIPEFQGFVFIVDDGDGFIMKLDMDGNVIWDRTIDATQGAKVRQTTDGYAICTTVWTWNEQSGDHQDFCLIKTDSEGNTVWRNLFGGTDGDHLYDFDLTSDGGYILGGHTVSYGVDNWDYLMMKIDAHGNEEWHRIFGQPRGYDARYIHDEAYGVRQTTDGGYVICGGSGDEHSYSESGHPAGPSDEWKVYVVRTDNQGNILWEGIYPGYTVGNNAGEYIGLTGDGGYIVFADTDTQGGDPNNYGFLKLGADPVTGITGDENSPMEFKLIQNYPNPFNPKTIINYNIRDVESGHAPSLQFVRLGVFDLLGNEVAILVNEKQSPGNYSVTWNAAGFPSGIYICRLITGIYNGSIKMNLIK